MYVEALDPLCSTENPQSTIRPPAGQAMGLSHRQLARRRIASPARNLRPASAVEHPPEKCYPAPSQIGAEWPKSFRFAQLWKSCGNHPVETDHSGSAHYGCLAESPLSNRAYEAHAML
jgi:hypothetical protein